jgi:hypothetical protein
MSNPQFTVSASTTTCARCFTPIYQGDGAYRWQGPFSLTYCLDCGLWHSTR